MKNLFAFFICILIFTSCDKVPPRVPLPRPDCVLDSSTLVVKSNTLTSNTRKVLIEDYTGHICGNCPPAAAKAEELVKNYNGRVILIANHVSNTFAAPKKTEYIEDFRDPASDEWDVFLNMSGAGLPKGTVNRQLIDGKYPQNFSAWEGQVLSEINKPQSVKLDITTAYDPSQKLLNIKVFTTFLSAYASNVNIQMVLTQDGIVADQKDYVPPPGVQVVEGGKRPDYEFNHIMVKSLNGTWGQLLKAAPIATKDTLTIKKDCNLSGKCFYKDEVCTNDEEMTLVVFAYNETTKEVLQVEKVKIR